ncbi:alkaline phosphatase family protein [Candidatus Nitrosocosmicus arcticus]|uniref:2,3-bisphosphoglycerate-independent phosphoglycerate mutase n=1 Tax=Candidatus Nitrosocosmicus arcticus TaxID=2035267 RepID=A0A557STB6_9ARCH|nr:alkaline phosphatase family protein [Candidatus Nitrosocosmicus arcticus]TVP39854.1 2,3-bisphosphoglycerate-independent phosphoglycerate mutase [Candidatus Nitrosocosmicus arcticus]
MNQSKIVYVLLDGIGDLPHPDLNYLTPLEAAYTPNLDRIARMGVSGQVVSVGDGIAPQSDIAVFNMLGYNFRDIEYFGRGVVECIGCGIDFEAGDLALRGNFATIDPTNKRILDRRAGRIVTEADSAAICDLIRKNVKIEGVEFSIEPTIGHRVVLRFRKKGTTLGENITNTDPAYDKINGIGIALDTSKGDLYVATSEPKDGNSQLSAAVINQFSDQVIEILDNCPVNIERREKNLLAINCILLRDAGNRYPQLQSINDKYNLNFASLVDMPVEIGISQILGMKSYNAGSTDEYELKAAELLKIIDNHDVVYVHIKGPDEFGHDGNAKGKKRNIDEIDKRFFRKILEGTNTTKGLEIYFIISGDHSTPCIKKTHTGDPIPIIVSGQGIQRDATSRFTESNSKRGSLGKIYGYQVLDTALKHLENRKV